MRNNRFSAFLLILFLLISLAAFSQTRPSLPAGVTQVTSVEGVTEYRLANGLRILLVPDASSAKTTVDVVYLVGSRDESYGETGMAHLLEHLMFKGSTAHRNIPEELSKHGALPNGTTDVDRTCYFETFSASDENLSWALSLESDRMVNSYIAKKDLDSEMTVVRNEMESGENNPEQILVERVLETAYLWHNYGHPTIGARSDVEGVPISRLQAFYHKYYQPDNAALIVAGKFDEAKTLTLIQQKFGAIPQPTRVLSSPYTREPAQDGPRQVVLERPGDAKFLLASYHIPPAGTVDAVALAALADILSDPANGRLRKRLVDTKLATAAEAEVWTTHDPGLIHFIAEVPKTGDLDAVRKEMIKLVQGIVQESFTQTELDRVKKQHAERFEKMMADGNTVGMYLTESLAEGDWRLLFWRRDQWKKLTLADLQSVAAKYLIESNQTIGEFIPVEKPIRATIPDTPNYAELLKGYQGAPALSAGEQFDPSPANIEARTTRTSIGAIKLALLSKKTRGSVVNATLQFHFGSESALTGKKTAASLVAEMLMRGTSKHDMQQLRDRLTALKTQMEVSGGPTEVTVSLQSDREHLTAALATAAEVLQSPTFPEKEFEEIKRDELVQLEQTRTDPQAIAELALERTLSPYPVEHVYGVPSLEQSIARLNATTLPEVKKFYKDFYGVGAAEIAIVGDFDSKSTSEVIAKLFANWKSPAKYQRVSQQYLETKSNILSFNTPDKQNGIFLAGMNLSIRDDDPDYPAMVLADYMLGGGFLNSRLATRIRQKEGLSYSVGSEFEASALDKVGSFKAVAIAAPQNLTKVAQAFGEEINRALRDGFTADELAAAKSGYLQTRLVVRSSDAPLSRGLARRLYIGRDFHWDERYEAQVKALTVEQVNAALNKFVAPQKMVTVLAGDGIKSNH